MIRYLPAVMWMLVGSCLAVAAESGRATIEQFEPLRNGEVEVQRLMRFVEISTDRTLGPKDYPSLEVFFKNVPGTGRGGPMLQDMQEPIEQAGVGVPDNFQRLWTPHRMAYIRGENKPTGSGPGDGCPFCEIARSHP